MIKNSILHCTIISVLIAAIASLCTITVSTASIQAEDMNATALREHCLDDAAQWSETKATTRSGLAAFIHNFTYPGFWVFWFRGFRTLFASLLVGTVSVTIWNEKRRSANQNLEHISNSADAV